MKIKKTTNHTTLRQNNNLPDIWKLAEDFALTNSNLLYCNKLLNFYIYKKNYWVIISKKEVNNLFINWLKINYPKNYRSFPPRRIEEIILVLETHYNFSMEEGKRETAKNSILLPFKNGLLNLKTLELLSHNQKYYNTYVIQIDYDKNANIIDTPFSNFLSLICDQNPLRLNLLRACLKAIITNNVIHQLALYIYGPGGTGKSTLIKLLIYLLGPDASISTSLNQLNSKFGLSNVYDKLLIILNDMSHFKGQEPKLLKEIISSDRMESEKKYKDAVSLIPKAWILIASNSIWEIRAATSGITRRMIYFPFFTIPVEKDNNLFLFEPNNSGSGYGSASGILVEHLPGFVNWILSCPESIFSSLQAGGDSLSSIINNNSFLLSTNPLSLWIDECLEPSDDFKSFCYIGNSKTQDETLFGSYSKWAETFNVEPIKRNRFSDLILERLISLKWNNISRKRNAKGMVITGIKTSKKSAYFKNVNNSLTETDNYLIDNNFKANKLINLGSLTDSLDFNNNNNNNNNNLSINNIEKVNNITNFSKHDTNQVNLVGLSLSPIFLINIQLESVDEINKNFSFNIWIVLIFSIILIIILIYNYYSNKSKVKSKESNIKTGLFSPLNAKIKNYLNKYIDFENKLEKFNKNSVVKGVKKGISVNLLPEKVELFYQNIFVRIFRVIGGVCVILLLTENHLKLPSQSDYFNIQNIVVIIGCIHITLVLIIILIKTCYGVYIILYKKEKLEVRNSPLDKLGSHIATFIACLKVGCVISGGTAAVIAAGASFDTLLEGSGRTKIFVPLMAAALNKFIGTPNPAYSVEKTQELITTRAAKVLTTQGEKTEGQVTVSQAVATYQALRDDQKVQFLDSINKQALEVANNIKNK